MKPSVMSTSLSEINDFLLINLFSAVQVDYFQGMFSSGFQESTMNEVTVPGTEDSFAQILDFAYTGYFTLSMRTVTGILKMACYMVYAEVVELCAEYLKDVYLDYLTFGDCFEVWSIAKQSPQSFRCHQIMQNPSVAELYKVCGVRSIS